MGKNSKHLKIDGRTYHAALDKFLADKRLKRKLIAKDGSCLFRAVSEQVYGSQSYHHKVRLKCMEYIRFRGDDFKEFITVPLEEYLGHLSKELWGGELELVVLSRVYDRSIVVYNERSAGREVQEQVFPSVEDNERSCTVDKLTNPILLAYSDGNHYDSVYSSQYLDDTAFCQGILYSMLVEKVFRQHVPNGCKRKLMHLQDSDVNSIVKYSPGQEKHVYNDPRTYSTLGRLGVDMAIAMSWTIYHNAVLSMHKWRKDGVEQRDRHMAASIQFHVGNRCYFNIDGKRMNGEITSLNVKPGIHLVHVYHSHKERWEIPVKDITLLSSHSTANVKQGKPHSSGEQSGHVTTRTPASGNKDASRSRQPKDGPNPATESPASTVPAASNSPTPSSVKKGKATPQSQQQTERAQKGSYKQRRPGNPASTGPVDTPSRHQEHVKTKPGSAKSAKTDHSGGIAPAAPGAGLPGSATLSPSGQQPTAPKAPYSSVVKKTAGGPSGSLTSEGTEYDESSGDEPAQEETKEGSNLPESSKFPAPHQSQGVVQHKPDKPLPVERGGGRDAVTEGGVAKESKSVVASTASGFTAATFQQTDSSLNSSTSIPSVESIATSTMISPRVQDTPYLEPQIPRGASSQPQDAWPEMPQASSTAIPPQNTMIYAAVMTNRSKQDPGSPISSSSVHTPFPYSASVADKPHFPKSFSPQHVMGSHAAASSPLVSSLQPPPPPQPGGRSMSSHTMLDGSGLGFTIPGHHTSGPRTRPQFQSSTLPSAYGLLPLGGHTGNEVYSTAVLPRAGSSPQVVGVGGSGGSGGFNSTRSPRMMEGATTDNLGPTNIPPLLYHTASTEAAAMEMRSILGIESRQQKSSNLPIFVGSSNFPASVSTSYIHPAPGPVTTDGFTQTQTPATSAKGVQVGKERISRSVQTAGPPQRDSETQTSGVFVPVEDLVPAQGLQMESVADQLAFAVRYSLQCLSAVSQTTGDGGENSEVVAALTELMDSQQFERLAEKTAQTSNLTASQQDFLRSVGCMPAEDSQPLTPQSSELSGRNEDITPQQEQHHMQSPGPGGMPPRMGMPFPFMIPPHPFMMHPPPPHHRMYYPFMAPMPVPGPPMGYPPMVPTMMPPHQMGPPPQSPTPEGGMGEQQQQQQQQQDEGNLPREVPPDNACHGLPVQGQLQLQDDAEVDGNPPPQQLPLPPPPPPPQQLPPPTQPTPSSEMVAPTDYPIPPSAMVQATETLPLPLPPPPPAAAAPPDVVTSAKVPEDQLRVTHFQKQPDGLVQQAEGSSTRGPDHTIPPSSGGEDQPSKPTATEPYQASTKVAPPLQKQPHHSTVQGAKPQLKGRNGSKKALQQQAAGNQEHPPTDEANQPGLPCRPQANHFKSGRQYQGGRGKGQGGGGGGGGEGQRKTTNRSKPVGTRNFNNRKIDSDEKSLSSVEGGRRETGKGVRPSRSHEKRHVQDHTGSAAVSGPSHKSTNQDPTRNIPLAFVRTRSRSSSSSNYGALLDTKDFKWGVPSPSANPDVILDSAPTSENTNRQPEPEEMEWPDWSEVDSVSSNVNKQKQTFSSSLKFTCGPAPLHGPDEQCAEVGDKGWDGPYEISGAETDSVEDPFPNVPGGTWQSDLGDFPFTLSPSQNICLAQCTGDLIELDRVRRTDLHKH